MPSKDTLNQSSQSISKPKKKKVSIKSPDGGPTVTVYEFSLGRSKDTVPGAQGEAYAVGLAEGPPVHLFQRTVSEIDLRAKQRGNDYGTSKNRSSKIDESIRKSIWKETKEKKQAQLPNKKRSRDEAFPRAQRQPSYGDLEELEELRTSREQTGCSCCQGRGRRKRLQLCGTSACSCFDNGIGCSTEAGCACEGSKCHNPQGREEFNGNDVRNKVRNTLKRKVKIKQATVKAVQFSKAVARLLHPSHRDSEAHKHSLHQTSQAGHVSSLTKPRVTILEPAGRDITDTPHIRALSTDTSESFFPVGFQAVSRDEISELPRRALQQLCKHHRLKANGKNTQLISLLLSKHSSLL